MKPAGDDGDRIFGDGKNEAVFVRKRITLDCFVQP
jgi:hypothetical protein